MASKGHGEAHVREWMTEGTAVSQLEKQDSAPRQELGFVSIFYQECQQLLSQVWKIFPGQQGLASKSQLRESLTRFMLWGAGWNDGRLDLCLGGSTELRVNVTELLSGLAKALIRCMRLSNNKTTLLRLIHSCRLQSIGGTTVDA